MWSTIGRTGPTTRKKNAGYGANTGAKHRARARRAKTQERDETIHHLAAQGWSQRGIAKHFGMSKTAIAHVLRMGGDNRTTPMGW